MEADVVGSGVEVFVDAPGDTAVVVRASSAVCERSGLSTHCSPIPIQETPAEADRLLARAIDGVRTR